MQNIGITDRSREMDERTWWDLWNTSHRTKENNDAVSGELFSRAAAIINSLTGNLNCRVLEIACGTGTLSRMISYSSYTGLDISPAAIQVANEKSENIMLAPGQSRPVYEAADFHEWPISQVPFDLAVCIDAISSIRDQASAMAKIRRNLRPGGCLVLTTINRFVYDRIQRLPSATLESGPVSHWLTRQELIALVKGANFQIKRAETIMPRGNLGILRVLNSPRLERALGPGLAAQFRLLKERCGLGQYSVVVARKPL